MLFSPHDTLDMMLQQLVTGFLDCFPTLFCSNIRHGLLAKKLYFSIFSINKSQKKPVI
jgi:hypothetical protein